MARLKITEIFYSLQGEADTAGMPTVFVRLTGCPLRCQYCDTEYAFHGGEWWEVESVVQRVRELGCGYVCVTGGEPLAQKSCLTLLTQLCDAGHRVSLETSGAMSLEGVDDRVVPPPRPRGFAPGSSFILGVFTSGYHLRPLRVHPG